MSLDENFVNAIYDELFEENFNRYKEILNQPIDHGKDSFARARNALALLDETERSQVINFFKVIMFDSASVVLGSVRKVAALGDAALKTGSECSFTASRLRFLVCFCLA
ncbi:hypothetical protein [Pseudomonas syringae group genomosp. 3]|uniref:Uncharacterized protein n=1 Tax=Pseudomonas syringae pv. persicae TaxID=237306 RepID=A0AB38EQB5_9PSED|nr:hypothetical protein [Pseudomonas syringae group genomosp. 3]SOQ12695.1 hypothetical protein CFBP1573P_04150 [Pseudomonas syringae pv. persicae]SOQ16699.1 hypothetical protein NCPPB2254_06056 [Pseudomonas syringae pv. persicae]